MFKKFILRFGKPLLGTGLFIAKLYWLVFRPVRFGAKAVVLCEQKILLVRHSYGTKNWSFPGGGIKKDELPGDGVKRELVEELSINEKITPEYAGFFTSNTEHKTDNVFVFVVRLLRDQIKIDPFEIEEAKWFSLDEIPALTSNAQKIFDIARPLIVKL